MRLQYWIMNLEVFKDGHFLNQSCNRALYPLPVSKQHVLDFVYRRVVHYLTKCYDLTQENNQRTLYANRTTNVLRYVAKRTSPNSVPRWQTMQNIIKLQLMHVTIFLELLNSCQLASKRLSATTSYKKIKWEYSITKQIMQSIQISPPG